MSVIAPYDREVLRQQFQSAQPFRWLKIDDFLQPSFADLVTSSYPAFDAAVREGRQFKAVNENLKVQLSDYATFPEPVKQLSDAVSSSTFLGDLEYITGIPKLLWDPALAGGGMHETARSGWLDVHVDFNIHKGLDAAHRRLNILIFLNPRWDERWGGILELWDEDVRTRVQAIMPTHNRCVVFETSDLSWHGVTAVECPEGVVRKSFAAYYYTREAPSGWDGQAHSTIFRPRPDEYMKRHLLMPAEAARQNVREGVASAKRVVKRLFGRDSK